MEWTALPHPSFVDQLEKMRTVDGQRRWRDENGLIYEYDGNHGGELEVYNKRGEHLGVADVHLGSIIKPARRGRRISNV